MIMNKSNSYNNSFILHEPIIFTDKVQSTLNLDLTTFIAKQLSTSEFTQACLVHKLFACVLI